MLIKQDINIVSLLRIIQKVLSLTFNAILLLFTMIIHGRTERQELP